MENKLKGNYNKELVTDRLILSPWNLSYTKKMYENWASDERVTKYLYWSPHKNVEETEQIILSWMSKANYNWCIRLKETGEPIGSLELVKNEEKDLKGEIGYCLSYNHWNKGYMTEALKKVIEFLFSEGYSKIYLRHVVENVGSGRVMQKAGMTFLVTSPKDCCVKGKIYDCNYYYILNPNYKY